MVRFVLVELGALLEQVRLYHAVKAVQYGLSQSSHNFYGILERYNPLTGTFFTPAGEMGLALMSYMKFWGWLWETPLMKNMFQLLKSFIY